MTNLSGIVPGDRPPILYRVAKILERRGVRGSSRLLRFLRRTGRLDVPVEFPIRGSLSVIVPIARNGYDRTDLDNYEIELIEMLSAAIQELPGRARLIDVGADIGLFSLKLLAASPSISEILAFEPNGEGFRWLELNLGRLNIPVRSINAAVADFDGAGRLAAPDAKWTPGVETNHTQFFLEPTPDGPIKVTKIDSVNPHLDRETLVLKVDVEGGEMAALRGAVRTITAAPNVIVAIEAHPSVTARTGIDPVECLRLLSSFRSFRFKVGETGLALNTEKAVFDQIPPDRVYNLVARSS